ncbi:hsp70-like protein [Capsaspora owczarzaki ATCC 30864]|uniref:Heat shock 70 kDa protein 14 n=1 Tax=Capsaspora owczarzaki (strain ATCC 30864) TaxID=595528 RepID=A0A0D2X370_CAPO3|nr:hsp70-like protein [Capsaspora owczarzaki ATCC 30864]KJE93794.1 hsp70-like protein [Capsaspora owczarzaki ATCC 30864]|eukprot:XP_004347284.1 hsp70-like protein [Capsaspora owczarzaki ATCC 30864]
MARSNNASASSSASATPRSTSPTRASAAGTAAAAAAGSSATTAATSPAPSAVIAGPGFGIAVGSSNACVAASRNEINTTTGRPNVDVIASDAGDRTTPAFVHFPIGQDPVVGSSAKAAALRFPAHVVTGPKHIAGLPVEHESVKKHSSRSNVKIVERDGEAYYEIDLDGKIEHHSPRDVSTRVYRKMREIADAFLGNQVQHAVITVPIEFDEARRATVKDAATKAGITVQRVISEPVAAAIAYGFDVERTANKTLAVFDFGAHSLDITVLKVVGGLFQVAHHTRTDAISGAALDEVLVKHFAAEFAKKNKVDITESRKSVAKLRAAVEPVKHTLSSSSTAICSVESLYEGMDLNGNVNRGRFEIISGPLLKQAVETLQNALTAAGLEPKDVDEVILAGGCSRIPKLQRLIAELFEGKEPLSSILPEEVFAVGAAVQSALLFHPEEAAENEKQTSAKATTSAIGVATPGAGYFQLIAAGTPLPVRFTTVLSTSDDNQTSVSLKLVERPAKAENADQDRQLASVVLRDVPAGPKGQARIELTVDVDAAQGDVRASLTLVSDRSKTSTVSVLQSAK